jgi:hypothetical protein
MAKNKSREDLAFPIAAIPKIGAQAKPQVNPGVIKSIIRGAIKGAYQLKTPSEPSSYGSDYGNKQKALVTEEQIQLVTHLIESLQPADVIEAALASQFAISYIQGLKASEYSSKMMDLFRFGHEVLEAMTKYRTKGAQLINVQYNHNQGQINNIKVVESENQKETIEVKSERLH